MQEIASATQAKTDEAFDKEKLQADLLLAEASRSALEVTKRELAELVLIWSIIEGSLTRLGRSIGFRNTRDREEADHS